MKNTVLIVDDDKENVKSLKTLLEGDYTVVFAENSTDALACASQQPDLILLDIMMPSMDGYKVCQTLQSEKQTKDIPIMVVTSKRESEDELKAFEMGVVDYVSKPVDLPVIKARIKAHIKMRLAYQEVNRQNASLIEANQFRQKLERKIRHDLKSPINGIVGFSDMMLADGSLSAEQTRQVKIMLDCGHKALRMINLSSGLFHMEQGTYHLEPHTFDLLPIIHHFQTDFSSLLRIKKISLKIQLHGRIASKEDSFFVHGEATLCHAMLTNLIKNAIEASEKDQTVTISLKDAGKFGVVRIHNQGAVPKTIRDRFFEKHVIADKKPGTGLGVYSAKLIAETQGGEIRMRTSSVKGTEIAVSIPIRV